MSKEKEIIKQKRHTTRYIRNSNALLKLNYMTLYKFCTLAKITGDFKSLIIEHFDFLKKIKKEGKIRITWPTNK